MHQPFKPTQIRSSILFALSAITLAISAPSVMAQNAAQLQEAARQGEVRLREERERLRVEQERNLRNQAPSGVNLKQVLPRTDASQVKGICHDIASISIRGAEMMDLEDRQSVADNFVGRCLAASDIEKLMGTLTQHYIERGFVTTRAYLPGQDLTTKKLELLVVEGRIERLIVEGDPQKRVNLEMTLPAEEGDLLNIRDLEQAVDQINAVSANKVKLDIQPGSAPGKSIVVFRNQAASPVGIQASRDNQGSESTGRDSVSTTVTLGGTLGLNENLSFTYRSSVPADERASSKSISAGLTLPMGYSTFNANASESSFSTGIPGKDWISSGKSTTISLTGERVLSRDQESLHSVIYGLNTVGSQNFVNGSLVSVSSQRASTISMGGKSTLTTAGGTLSLKTELAVGVNNQNMIGISSEAQPEFTKVTADINFSKQFKLDSHDLSWTSGFHSQLSTERLLASQQISIGGLTSVRGFTTNSISGDSGYYWRNELALHKQIPMVDSSMKTKFYAGFDVGSVNSNSDTEASGFLTGMVLGLNAQYKAATVDLSWTNAGALNAGMTREAAQTWLRVSFSL